MLIFNYLTGLSNCFSSGTFILLPGNMVVKIHFVLLLILASWFCSAQTLATSKSDKSNFSESRIDALTKDLLTQIPSLKSKVSWKVTSYGAMASFDMGYEQHISLYDKTGHYMETLKKSNWSRDTSPTIKMGFETSIYGLLPVLTYWENISLDDHDYYFELLGTDGNSKEVWADSNGNFFDTPLFVK